MAQTQQQTLDERPSEQMVALFEDVLSRKMDKVQWAWAKAQIDQVHTRFSMAFSMAPFKAGKQLLKLTDQERNTFDSIHKGFSIDGWSISRIFRVLLLLRLDESDQLAYIRQIEQLFRTAEMNELVALYSGLPLLSYPEAWRMRCAEGIRSNIGDVLRAIICNNPYPAEQLEEGPWNQLVLKAFFVGLPIEQIVGLHQRMNARLADTLIDYRAERLSAGREVHPMIDQLLIPFRTEIETKQDS